MTSHAAPSPSLRYFLPLAAMLSGCVIHCGDGEVQCNGDVCCDDFGCWDNDFDGDGGGNYSTTSGVVDGGASAGGASQGGASQGGASQGGAGPGCDDTLIVCPCADSSECPAGLSCLDGQCLTPCEFDYHCGDAQVCADGECVASCEIGVEPCAIGYVCVGGGCLPDPAAPECVDGSTCASTTCVNGFCTTLCTANADCPAGQLCDAATSSCFADPSPQTVCDEMTPCGGSGQQCEDDGYCHYGCLTTEECKLIDARYDACDRGICKTDLELDPDCSYELPCPPGSFCVSNECATPPGPQ